MKFFQFCKSLKEPTLKQSISSQCPGKQLPTLGDKDSLAKIDTTIEALINEVNQHLALFQNSDDDTNLLALKQSLETLNRHLSLYKDLAIFMSLNNYEKFVSAFKAVYQSVQRHYWCFNRGESVALEMPSKEQIAGLKNPCSIFSFDQRGNHQPLTDKKGNLIVPSHEQWEQAMAKFLADGRSFKRVEYSAPLNPSKGLIIYTFKPGEKQVFLALLISVMNSNEASITVKTPEFKS